MINVIPLAMIVYGSPEISDMNGIEHLVKMVEGDERELTEDDSWDSKQWVDSAWEKQRKNFIVAKHGDLIVGCIRTIQVYDDVVELSSLAVLLKYRSKSIGSSLVVRLLKKHT